MKFSKLATGGVVAGAVVIAAAAAIISANQSSDGSRLIAELDVTPSLSAKDVEYLSKLADYGVYYESNEAAIGLADAVCDYIDSGAAFHEAVMTIHNYGGWDLPTAQYIGGAAIAAYCPEHAGKI